MKEIRKNRLFVDYLVKPVMLGLFVAAVLIVLVPDFRPTTNSPSDDLMTLEQANISSDWAGQVSYAVAVSRAAPSVVNVYTLKGTNNGSFSVKQSSRSKRRQETKTWRFKRVWCN